jgi:hypothetical protein
MTARPRAVVAVAMVAALGLAACGSDSGTSALKTETEKGPCIAEARPGEGPACGALAKRICSSGPIDPRCVAAGLQPQQDPSTTDESSTDSGDSAESASSGTDFGSPDFVIAGRTNSGDKVQILGHVGEATTLEASDADQEALASCSGASNGRAMVARLDLRTTVTSGLPAQVRLTQFNRDGGYDTYALDFLMNYSDGPQCGDGGLEQVVDLGELQPDQAADFSLWVVLDDAITPNDPHPSNKTLGRHALLKPPIVFLGDGELAYGTADSYKLGGPRVIDCDAGRAISIAGTVPKQVASSGTGYSMPCRPTATPRFVR